MKIVNMNYLTFKSKASNLLMDLEANKLQTLDDFEQFLKIRGLLQIYCPESVFLEYIDKRLVHFRRNLQYTLKAAVEHYEQYEIQQRVREAA